MNTDSRIVLSKKQCRQALSDYFKHTPNRQEACDRFFSRLAKESVEAKSNLRALFSQSPNWNEELDAIIVKGTGKPEIDCSRIYSLMRTLFSESGVQETTTHLTRQLYNVTGFDNLGDALGTIVKCAYMFGNKTIDRALYRNDLLSIIDEFAPKAMIEGKKISRAIVELAKATGHYSKESGSSFQKTFAQLSDLVSANDTDEYDLIISLNPAHFLTMSNPHEDSRGETLVSCHSLNCTNYGYNAGCTGYARDNCSFIAFTVSDLNNAESYYNRKTSRQMFFHNVGSLIYLQSRLYNTRGGTQRGSFLSDSYFKTIGSVLAELYNVSDVWDITPFESYYFGLKEDSGFGGYQDWDHFEANYGVHESISDEKFEKNVLHVGESGLCFSCGDDTSDGIFCSSCDSEEVCAACGERILGEVCWGPNDEPLCRDCMEHTERCDHCGTYVYTGGFEVMTTVYVHDDEECWCEDCTSREAAFCESCGYYVAEDEAETVEHNCVEDTYCSHCLDELNENGDYVQCECGTWVREDQAPAAISAYGYHSSSCSVCATTTYTNYCERDNVLMHRGNCDNCDPESPVCRMCLWAPDNMYVQNTTEQTPESEVA